MYTIYVCTNDRVVCLPGENLPSLAEEASLLDPTSRTFEDGGEREAREKEREKESVSFQLHVTIGCFSSWPSHKGTHEGTVAQREIILKSDKDEKFLANERDSWVWMSMVQWINGSDPF